MISIDNTKNPFIKSRKLRKAGDYFRRSGVKGYRVPSTGEYLEGSGSGDAGPGDLEARDDGVPQAGAQHLLQGSAAPDRDRPPGHVPSLFGLGISGAIRKLEAAGFTVETQYVYDDDAPYGAFLGWSPGPGQTISEFGTVFLTALAGQGPGGGRGREEEERRGSRRAETATPAAAAADRAAAGVPDSRAALAAAPPV